MKTLVVCAFTFCASLAYADGPRVATDIAPVHILVSQVMADVGNPDFVIPIGASPHAYAMRPSEARALSRADIVFWVGPELTPWMTVPIDALASDAAKVLLSDLPELMRLEMREDARFDGHDHDEDDDHGHAEDASDDHAVDPPFWLDPYNAMIWIDKISETLAAADEANSETYCANAKQAKADLKTLSMDIQDSLAPYGERPFIVTHDAYRYFEERFGVEAVAAITLGNAEAASAAHLAKVGDTVAHTGAVCALVEPRAGTGLIDAVAQGTQITIMSVDPMGVKIPAGAEFYTALLRQLAQSLEDCLSET